MGGQKFRQSLLRQRVAGGFCLHVSELCFRLSLELDVLHFYGQNGGHSLAVILAYQIVVLFFKKLLFPRVVVEHLGHRRLEARLVGASLRRGNVVDIGKDIFRITRGLLNGKLHNHDVVACGVAYRRMQHRLVFVKVSDEIGKPAFVAINRAQRLAVLSFRSQIRDGKLDSLVEKRKLLDALVYRVEIERSVAENLFVGKKSNARAVLRLVFAALRLLKRLYGNAALDLSRFLVVKAVKALNVFLAVAEYLYVEPL